MNDEHRMYSPEWDHPTSSERPLAVLLVNSITALIAGVLGGLFLQIVNGFGISLSLSFSPKMVGVGIGFLLTLYVGMMLGTHLSLIVITRSNIDYWKKQNGDG